MELPFQYLHLDALGPYVEGFLGALPFAEMSRMELGYWSFIILLLLIFLRAPIGLAMLLVGFGGWYYAMNGNPVPLLNKLKSETYTTFSSYSLSIIPMFLLMGQFATLSGMSSALFKAAESFLGHRRGGVAMAAVGACAGFGAICGSSLATAATMGRTALPELKRYGYSGGFSTAPASSRPCSRPTCRSPRCTPTAASSIPSPTAAACSRLARR